MNHRIMPRLDIKGPNLVIGKPEQFARDYYETGADGLIYMDVVASFYDRNSLHDIWNYMENSKGLRQLAVGGGRL